MTSTQWGVSLTSYHFKMGNSGPYNWNEYYMPFEYTWTRDESGAVWLCHVKDSYDNKFLWDGRPLVWRGGV